MAGGRLLGGGGGLVGRAGNFSKILYKSRLEIGDNRINVDPEYQFFLEGGIYKF